MPDGRIWCNVTFGVVKRNSFEVCPIGQYEPGSATIYKPVPMERPKIITKGEPKKPKQKEVIPKILVKRSSKKKPNQTRLF